MLRYALLAIGAAMAIAVVFVMLPTGGGQRPEPRILSSGDTLGANGFVIHPAAPPGTDPAAPAVAPGAAPAAASDLDAVMQRLRAAGAKPDAPAQPAPPPGVTPAATPPGLTTANSTTPPATTPPATPPTVVAPGTTPPATAVPDTPPALAKWTAITGQGTRWRMARSDNGFNVAIDLGGGQVANVHVQPAFGALDPASINVRVDYLRQTIQQNFSRQSGSYTFARDGSVSVDR